MKSKESPNLYEILKTTIRPEKGSIVSVEQPLSKSTTPEEPTRVSSPREAVPGSVYAPRTGEESREPGEKIIQITYNTAIFLVLTGVGLLFIAYAIGVRSGRARAIAEIPMRPQAQESVFVERETPPPIPASANILAPEPEKMWTITLLEWTGQTARDRVKAQQNAERIKKSLTQNGFRASYYQLVTRNGKKYVVLRYGKFAERSGSEARKMLERLRAFKYRGTAHFARAGLETIDKD
jgi:hypothetical protein